MKIRKMTVKDVPAVIAIDKTHFKSPMSESELIQGFKDRSNGAGNAAASPIVSIGDQGGVVGYALFGKHVDTKGTLAIFRIAVAKDCERQGVATGMIDHIKSKTKVMKCRSVVSKVHQERIPAMNLFAKHGFTCTGTRDFTQGEESFEVYDFCYSVPLDDLSARHIAKIAKSCREERVNRKE